ncbi:MULTISPECIES: AtpZ/AtpI family protein [unclassified Blastococcus]
MAEDDPRPGSARPSPDRPAGGGSGAETGWAVTGTLISGMAVWGGAGWLLDQWLDTRVFFPVGIILGMAVAIYVVVLRFGGLPSPSGAPRTRHSTSPGGRRSRPRTQKGQR